MKPFASSSTFLYLNIALGALVSLANGGALTLVLLGRGGNVSNQAVEISIWFAAGVALLITAVYALRHSDRIESILRLHLYLVVALAIALAAWALTIISSPSISGHVVWSAGYLSVVALYCAILGAHVFPAPDHGFYRKALYWIFVPASVIIDIFASLKVNG